MTARTKIQIPEYSEPMFPEEVNRQVARMAQLDTDTMAALLHVSKKLAAQNCMRYQEFHEETNLPLAALLSYTGIVFKRIAPQDFQAEDFLFAQDHLRITSFLYGLLRPLDLIRNYRLEGQVPFEEESKVSIFDHWKPLLTDVLIQEVKKQGGVLVNLASGEMKDLFFWKQVADEVRVITPEFYVLKDGQPKTVVVYTKMCRGEMTRFLIRNRITEPAQLEAFSWEGFTYDAARSTPEHPVFCLTE